MSGTVPIKSKEGLRNPAMIAALLVVANNCKSLSLPRPCVPWFRAALHPHRAQLRRPRAAGYLPFSSHFRAFAHAIPSVHNAVPLHSVHFLHPSRPPGLHSGSTFSGSLPSRPEVTWPCSSPPSNSLKLCWICFCLIKSRWTLISSGMDTLPLRAQPPSLHQTVSQVLPRRGFEKKM